mmetsp:Transcript_38001/g.98619  ORF Transcript_38001/g.98619 Transcript_38001/m.98619 type:complete len:276 (-) Transcript_38001:774-1601(-)
MASTSWRAPAAYMSFASCIARVLSLKPGTLSMPRGAVVFQNFRMPEPLAAFTASTPSWRRASSARRFILISTAASALSTRCRLAMSRRVRAIDSARDPSGAASGACASMGELFSSSGARVTPRMLLLLLDSFAMARSASMFLYSEPPGGRPNEDTPPPREATSSSSASRSSPSTERSRPRSGATPLAAVGTKMWLALLSTGRSGPRKRSCIIDCFANWGGLRQHAVSRDWTTSSSPGAASLSPRTREVVFTASRGSGARCMARVRGTGSDCLGPA